MTPRVGNINPEAKARRLGFFKFLKIFEITFVLSTISHVIFNLKNIHLEFEQKELKRAQDTVTAMSAVSRTMMEYRKLRDILSPGQNLFEAPVLILLPRKENELLIGIETKRAVEYLLKIINNNRDLREHVGLMNEKEFLVQQQNSFVIKQLKKHFHAVMGIVDSTKAREVLPLNKLEKDFDGYRYLNKYLDPNMIEIPVNAYELNYHAAVLFGAVNPYYFHLQKLLRIEK